VVLRYPHPEAGATAAPVAHAAAGHSALRRWLRRRRDPAMATGLALTVAVAVVAAGGAVLGVLAYAVRSSDALRGFDEAASRWGRDHASGVTDRAIEGVTQLGETWLVVIAGLVLVVVEWRRGRRSAAPFLLLVVAGDKLVTTLVKELADRARPTLNPLAESLGPSFPSGHTSTAAAFFGAAALVLGRGASRRGRALLAATAVGVAVAVACSRVLLAVHWVSDVVAGLALGWAWFALCAVAFGGRLLRFGSTVARAEREAVEPVRGAGR